MKKLLFLSLLVVSVMLVGAPARADLVAVSADAVLNYDYNHAGDVSNINASGYKVGVSVPIFFVGLGYETYTVKSKLQQKPPLNSIGFESDVTMFDVFADVPFPFLNLTVGAGVGKATFAGYDEFNGSQVVAADDASMKQVFFTVGYPFLGIFDVHLGYHSISGKATQQGGGGEFDLGASMLTLGMRVGF